MGTHTSSPSRVHHQDSTLLDYLRDHPQLLGPKVAKRFKGNLPFLLKVLSVEKALSIQVHPDKADAERLHQASPKIYTGDLVSFRLAGLQKKI
jgi:mannose-6-phosphate isomerase